MGNDTKADAMDDVDHVANARTRSDTFKTRLRTTAGFVAAFAAALTTGLTLNTTFTSGSRWLALLAMISVIALIVSAVTFVAGSVVTPPPFERIEARLEQEKWQTKYKKLHHGNPAHPGDQGKREIVSGLGLARAKGFGIAGQVAGLIGASALISLLVVQYTLTDARESVVVYATAGQTWNVCGQDVDRLRGEVNTMELVRGSSTVVEIETLCRKSQLLLLIDRTQAAIEVDD